MSGQKKSWWGRNWLWAVPVGCLGLFVLFVIVVVAAMAGLGFKIIKSSTPYVQAVAAAKADPRVIAALGSPVKAGWYFSGTVNENHNWSSGSGSTSSGDVDLRISIHGPKGDGTIHVMGKIIGGKWVYSMLDVTVKDTGEFIDLQEKPKKTERRENPRPCHDYWFAGRMKSPTRMRPA